MAKSGGLIRNKGEQDQRQQDYGRILERGTGGMNWPEMGRRACPERPKTQGEEGVPSVKIVDLTS